MIATYLYCSYRYRTVLLLHLFYSYSCYGRIIFVYSHTWNLAGGKLTALNEKEQAIPVEGTRPTMASTLAESTYIKLQYRVYKAGVDPGKRGLLATHNSYSQCMVHGNQISVSASFQCLFNVASKCSQLYILQTSDQRTPSEWLLPFSSNPLHQNLFIDLY